MITKTIQRTSLPITKAPTNTRPIEARNTMVAAIRTGLNISLSCFAKPIKKPVPIKDITVPTAYNDANAPSKPKNSRMDPSSERAKPITRQPIKP